MNEFLVVFSLALGLFTCCSFIIYESIDDPEKTKWFKEFKLKEATILELIFFIVVSPILLCFVMIPIQYVTFLLWIKRTSMVQSIIKILNYQPFRK